jgi:cytochrome P450
MRNVPTEPVVFPAPRAADCPFDPPPDYRKIQDEAPISRLRLWDGSTPWLITRYADQRVLLSDPRLSSDATNPAFPHVSGSFRPRSKDAVGFITMDDPDHARLRRMVIAPFAIKRIEAMRSAIQQIVDGLIDDMLVGPKPVDLVQAFALPVPSLVICELLGVPYADHDFFQQDSKKLVNRDTPLDEVLAAQNRLLDYLDDLVDRKLAEPDDALLSRLVTERLATGELSRRDLATMGMFLLVSGHETTANMIALGTAALLQHPDQLALLRDTDDQKLIVGAVEELLRYLNILHLGRRRFAREDIEINGHVIKAGEGIVLASDIGNRDPDAFPGNPDELDITRDARRHIAFGFGPHQCLGQSLARVELQVVYGTLYRRIPTLRLATDLSAVPFKHDALIYGVYELPVIW